MKAVWRPKKYVQVQLYDYPKLYTYKFRDGYVGQQLYVETKNRPGLKRAVIKKLGRGTYLGPISDKAYDASDEFYD